MKTGHYDAIVIGAGQAGVPLSVSLGQAGRRTALLERAFVGGTCINYGCTPTKTMVASGRVARALFMNSMDLILTSDTLSGT